MIDLTRHPLLLKLLYLKQRFQHWRLARRRAKQGLAEQRGGFYENLWQETARQAGATIEALGEGFFEICRDGRSFRVKGNCCSRLDDLLTSFLASTKPLVYQMLARQGLPVPRHLTFTLGSIRKAAEFLKGSGRPCVVKPAEGSQAGQGVTTGIRKPNQLARAALAASIYSRDLLLEEQAEGENFRLLYLDGVLLDAVMRKPPVVVGDGRSTIAQLVEQTNAERLRMGPSRCPNLLSIDLEMQTALLEQGLSLRTVPASGKEIRVKTVINQNQANDNVTATKLLGEELIREGAQAARIVGARLAGVDIITRDPSVSLKQSGGVFLEVNTTPGYHHHYHKLDGSFPVAAHVLEALLGRPENPAVWDGASEPKDSSRQLLML